VISNYGIGMGIGGFDLTIGQKKVAFNIGLPKNKWQSRQLP
jgi:hypothetical protein